MKRNLPSSPTPDPHPSKHQKAYLRYLSLGFELAASLGGPIWIGYLLDQKIESAPWYTLGGIFTGMILFFYTIFKTVKSVRGDHS